MKRVGPFPSRFRRCAANRRYQTKAEIRKPRPRPPIGELTGEHDNACRWGRATDAVLVPPVGGTHQYEVLSGRPPRTPSRNRPKPWFTVVFPKAQVAAVGEPLRLGIQSPPEAQPRAAVHVQDGGLHKRVGEDSDFLWSRSPLSKVDDIRIPVLVVWWACSAWRGRGRARRGQGSGGLRSIRRAVRLTLRRPGGGWRSRSGKMPTTSVRRWISLVQELPLYRAALIRWPSSTR